MHEESTAHPRQPSMWWVIFPVSLGLLCVVLMLVVYHYYEAYHQISDDYNSLYFRAQQAESDILRYRRLASVYDSLSMQIKPTLTSDEIAVLSKKGLDDPYTELVDNLISNPHLRNVEIGELFFEMPNQVCILGPDRALAAYDSVDGAGHALLAYSVDDQGHIEWELMERVTE